MPEYADIYALSEDRTEQAISRFVDCFLPSRVQSANEYEIPQYSDLPRTVYTDASHLIRHCCACRNEVHTIYWRSDVQPEHAMVFFLADGALVLGISTPAENSTRVDHVAYNLERHVGTDEVIVTYEHLPPESMGEFRTLLQSLQTNPDESARSSRIHRRIKSESGKGDPH